MRKRLACGVLWVIVSLSFIFNFLGNDFAVFFKYAQLVAASDENGIYALLSVVEIKGLLYRVILYWQYILVSPFLWEYTLPCIYLYKAFAWLQIELILLLSVCCVPKHYFHDRVCAFLMLSCGFFGVHFMCHLQPEMYAVALLLLSTAFYLRKTLLNQFVSSIIFVAVFYMKSPAVLMGGSLFFAVALIENLSFWKAVKAFIPFIAMAGCLLCGSVVLVHVFIPQEIDEILNTSYFQPTLLHASAAQILMAPVRFMRTLLTNVLFHYPVLIFAVILSISVGIKEWKNRKVLLAVAMWIFPLCYVMVSNMYFGYHYYLFIYPSIVTIWIIMERGPAYLKTKHVNLVLLGVSLFYIFVLSGFAPNMLKQKREFDRILTKMYNNHITFGMQIQNGPLLYLDNAMGSVVFTNTSYLKYFYPLPIQRVDESTELANMDFFLDSKARVLDYTGLYVILRPDWFFKYEHPEIRKKLEEEYIEVNSFLFPSISWGINPKVSSKEYFILKRRKV